MFTGIIQAVGKVIKCDGNRLWIRAPFRGVRLGESMAVSGVCLTVAARRAGLMAFDVGTQTLRLTTLGKLQKDDHVNLERALRVGDALGGHWVSGHVEAIGTLTQIRKGKRSRVYTFQIPQHMRRYIVARGSIAIDGVSLTVASARGKHVRVMLIPHTLSHTTLGENRIGDRVNLEPDLLAKYVLR